MEQIADRTEATAVDDYFSSPTENILFQSAYGHRETDRQLFCDVPSVSQ